MRDDRFSPTGTRRPLHISASSDPSYPYCVCPVDDDGVDFPPIADFKWHDDALRFVAAMNQPRRETYCPDCGEFHPMEESGPDFVCAKCRLVLLTFREVTP